MFQQLIVVDSAADRDRLPADMPVVEVGDYLLDPDYQKQRGLRVINLCGNLRYLGTGYYCSLLAEARRQRVLPSTRSMLELANPKAFGLDTGQLAPLVQKALGRRSDGPEITGFAMDIFMGETSHAHLQELARRVFAALPCPMLRVELRKAEDWQIAGVSALSLDKLNPQQLEAFNEALAADQKKRWQPKRSRRPLRYDLALLYDAGEKLPPSNLRALHKFVKAGRQLGIDVELIQKRDLHRLSEFDALFIRETTRINHHTYRYARRGQNEGLVVIDDPDSILKCTNKVYLAELLRGARVPTPRSLVLRRANLLDAEQVLDYPMVLKIPEGSFSRGVHKAEDREALKRISATMFKESDLILAQEYMYTDFDWRVGILNHQPLFVSQYFMSKKHWQIVRHESDGKFTEGGWKTIAVEDAPPKVIKTALRAARLIGDGLYGVDVKQVGERVVVIEVNDNPNIEAGVEDQVLKDELYLRIMGEFARRLEKKFGSDK